MFKRSTLVLLTVLPITGILSATARAETAGPGWEVTSTTYPTNLAPAGGTGTIELNVYNIGAAPSSGPVTVTDVLPEGVVAIEAGDLQEGFGGSQGGNSGIGLSGLWDCSTGQVVTCTNDPLRMPALPIPITNPDVELADEGSGAIEHIAIAVEVTTATPETLTNRVTVAGGGAPAPASTAAPISINPTPASTFGFQGIDSWMSNADGTLDTQAGSHPYEMFFSFDLNTNRNSGGVLLEPAGGQPRDLSVNVPAGLVGNPTAVPECTRQNFEEEKCPAATQIGVDQGFALGGEIAPAHNSFPVYNLVPPPGMPAQFALSLFSIQVFLDASVRSGGDYGITVHADNLPQKSVEGNRIILWGEPSNPAHDEDRATKDFVAEHCQARGGCVSNAPRVPFLTLATSCSGPESFSIDSSTWETAGFGEASFLSHNAGFDPAGLSGCDHLGFTPSVSVAPDTSDADTPAGLTVDVRVPQEGLLGSEALATSNIKDTTVVLPAGVVINPGQAAGLQACPAGRPAPGVYGDAVTTEEEKAKGKEDSEAASCPNASKVGTVQIATPLLKEDLEGGVYVLQSNPPHLRLLVAASGEGVNLKLVGDVELCETTGEVINGKACEAAGQIVTTFSETPELPFTDFKLSFSGGAQAALDTPTGCGTYTTTSDFTPWSTPAVGDAFPSSNFLINKGPGGSGCPGGTLGFTPGMIAGATSDQAGAYTNFSLLLQRGDDQQRIEKLAFQQPAGLGGVLTGVPLCDEANANAGTCPASSQIGHALVASGPGPYPLVLPQPGAPELPIYLTGPYKGAPFGLSIVTPVLAGPFNLGTVITRAKIEIDPRTAQISVTTDPLPQEVDGVPTDLRAIQSVIDRPGFLYDPTNCQPQQFTGTATSTNGTTAPLSSPFDVGSCRSLEFHPKITATTGKQASKNNGAGVLFKITYPKAPQGTQTWLKEVKFNLPEQLPARLTTIQKACLAHVFETNRPACPAASIIGHAIVRTQVLPVPLEGPVYFVSYGSAKFPEAVLVLKGDGVTLEEHGETFINSKTGVTSATFKNIPDDPFESVEVNIPTGPNSEFATNIPAKDHYNLCGQHLIMPTLFKAQNGQQTTQNTPITITGCPKPHKTKHHKTKKASHHNTHNKKKHG
ncbi:MAG TPA: hypothetical protein VK790_01080 [Solirubrobacteraceae bacterium]|jgi:uncharacterized repeat protein (TIGR01451 family)|nr:hypothetical protein [Solirubrobacteraceae bacterium]